jgi:hypothetical protein
MFVTLSLLGKHIKVVALAPTRGATQFENPTTEATEETRCRRFTQMNADHATQLLFSESFDALN